MKGLWDNARYPVIRRELLWGALCLKYVGIPRHVVALVLEYVVNSVVQSDVCECHIDRCHWCVYQHTDAVGGPWRLPFHKECDNCTMVTYYIKEVADI